jgi:hypothetical protein
MPRQHQVHHPALAHSRFDHHYPAVKIEAKYSEGNGTREGARMSFLSICLRLGGRRSCVEAR